MRWTSAAILDQPQIKPNDKIWFATLSSTNQNHKRMVDVYGIQKYNFIVWNLVKSCSSSSLLPSNSVFFRVSRDCNLIDRSVKLFLFKAWLEKLVKDLFTPLGEIIPIQEAQLKQNKNAEDKLYKNRIESILISKDIEQSHKNEKETPAKPKARKKLICWVCKDKHLFMGCPQFRKKSVRGRKDFVTLCTNCS